MDFSRHNLARVGAWPSRADHICTERCDTHRHGDIIFCTLSGNYHICTQDTCPYQREVGTNEALVCVMTGTRYACELDETDVQFTGSSSRDSRGDTLPTEDDVAEYYEAETLNVDEKTSTEPCDERETKRRPRKMRKRTMTIETHGTMYETSGYIKYIRRLLGISLEHAVPEPLQRHIHETCVAFEIVAKATDTGGLKYNAELHAYFVAYTLVTDFYHDKKLVAKGSPTLNKILPNQKRLASLDGVNCRHFTKYSRRMKECIDKAEHELVSRHFAKLAVPPM